IHIFLTVYRDQKELLRFEFETAEHVRRVNPILIVLDNFEDGIARDKDAMSVETFTQQVHAAALSVWHEHITAVIDDAPVYFFRYPIVITAIAGLHVINRNAQSLGGHCREGAVRVPENQKPIRP